MWTIEGQTWQQLWEKHSPYLSLLLRSTLNVRCGFIFPHSLLDACHLTDGCAQTAAPRVYRALESGEPWQQELPAEPPLEARALLFVFVTHMRSKKLKEQETFRAELSVPDAQWYRQGVLEWDPPPLREWKHPPWHAADMVRYLYVQFDGFITEMRRAYRWEVRTRQRADNKVPADTTLQWRWRARPTYYAPLMEQFEARMQLELKARKWLHATSAQARFIRCYFATAFYRRCVDYTPGVLSMVEAQWLVGYSKAA